MKFGIPFRSPWCLEWIKIRVHDRNSHKIDRSRTFLVLVELFLWKSGGILMSYLVPYHERRRGRPRCTIFRYFLVSVLENIPNFLKFQIKPKTKFHGTGIPFPPPPGWNGHLQYSHCLPMKPLWARSPPASGLVWCGLEFISNILQPKVEK